MARRRCCAREHTLRISIRNIATRCQLPRRKVTTPGIGWWLHKRVINLISSVYFVKLIIIEPGVEVEVTISD